MQKHSAISTATTIITGCVYKPDNAVDKQWLECAAAFPAHRHLASSLFHFLFIFAGMYKREIQRVLVPLAGLFSIQPSLPPPPCIECRVTRLSLWKKEGELSLNGRSLFVPFTVEYNYCWIYRPIYNRRLGVFVFNCRSIR